MDAPRLVHHMFSLSAMPELSTSLARELQIPYYLSTIYFVILYYDYLLTLPAEVKLFWLRSRRLSWPSVLFFVNRYGALLGHIPLMVEVLIFPSDLTLVGIITCAMRVSAIYDHYRPVLALLIFLILGCIILGLIRLLGNFRRQAARPGSPAHLRHLRLQPDALCLSKHPYVNPRDSTAKIDRICAWDFVNRIRCGVEQTARIRLCGYLVLTVAKAIRIVRQFPGSLVHVLLRDGAWFTVDLQSSVGRK
ncbi:hypothetical protein EVG20_g6934 [Dentipellis fragilis]|uniref:DUF6533 domain-containing protein n=1 Tax=Dentipellis fragilis TaxID=205917 RepID=A0A4Y9YI01_9AGAM|nr:hypothetical protein EVG20_g6934 [Dentipellis fragilis]